MSVVTRGWKRLAVEDSFGTRPVEEVDLCPVSTVHTAVKNVHFENKEDKLGVTTEWRSSSLDSQSSLFRSVPPRLASNSDQNRIEENGA